MIRRAIVMRMLVLILALALTLILALILAPKAIGISHSDNSGVYWARTPPGLALVRGPTHRPRLLDRKKKAHGMRSSFHCCENQQYYHRCYCCGCCGCCGCCCCCCYCCDGCGEVWFGGVNSVCWVNHSPPPSTGRSPHPHPRYCRDSPCPCRPTHDHCLQW